MLATPLLKRREVQIVEHSAKNLATNTTQVQSNDDSINATLVAALAYAREGLKVLPVYAPDPSRSSGCSCPKADCSSPGKHPISSLVRRGHKDATTDPEVIRSWFAKYPGANIAAVPGDDEFVVDVDPRHGGEESFRQLEQDFGSFETRHMRTGSGGAHYWFKSEGPVRGRVGLLDGIDIKTSSGYVVMPPSKHVDGAYEALDMRPPQAAPPRLVDLITRRKTPSKKQASDTPRQPAPERVPPVDGKIPDGTRNTTLMSLGGTMRAKGMGSSAIHAALHAENRDRCAPPLPSMEVETIANNISLYPPGDEDFIGEPLAIPNLEGVDPAFREAMAALQDYSRQRTLCSPNALSVVCDLVSKIPSRRDRALAEATLSRALDKTVGARRVENLLRLFTPRGDKGGFTTDDQEAVVIRPLQPTDVAPDQRFLVEGLIPAAAVGALVADFSMGKSWLPIDLALSIAFGLPWFGHEVSEHSVIFLVAEGNQDFPARIFGWLVEHELLASGATVEEMFKLLSGRVVINKVPVRFDHPDFEKALVGTIEGVNAGLVVVDTLGKTLGADQSENDNDVANDITGMLSTIAAQTGCTTLFTHHVGHVNGGRARGASALEQGLDFEYIIDGKRDDFDTGKSVRVACRKMRSAPKPPPFSFRLKKLPGLEWVPSGSKESTVVDTAVVESAASTGRPASLEATIFRFIERSPGCSQAALRTATAGRRDDVNQAITRLAEEGAIENRGKPTRHQWHVVEGWCVGGSGEVENLFEAFPADTALPTGLTAQS